MHRILILFIHYLLLNFFVIVKVIDFNFNNKLILYRVKLL